MWGSDRVTLASVPAISTMRSPPAEATRISAENGRSRRTVQSA
jgi:hypothetical protein